MLYEVVHALLPPVAKAVWRPTVLGLDNLPETGPVIVASNHLSFADSMIIPFVVPRKVVFLAKEDYFTGTGVKGTLIRAWFEGIGCFTLGDMRRLIRQYGRPENQVFPTALFSTV